MRFWGAFEDACPYNWKFTAANIYKRCVFALQCFTERLIENDLTTEFGGVVHSLHHLRSNSNGIDMRRKLFAGVDAFDKAVDFLLEVGLILVLGLEGAERAAGGGEYGEVAAVGKTDTCLGADEIDIAFADTDILCPCAVEGDGRTGGTNKAGNHIVYVISAVNVLGVFSPHAFVYVVGHINTQLGVCVAGNGLGSGVAGTVHNDIKVMYAPVDKYAAAGVSLGGESAAQAGIER